MFDFCLFVCLPVWLSLFVWFVCLLNSGLFGFVCCFVSFVCLFLMCSFDRVIWVFFCLVVSLIGLFGFVSCCFFVCLLIRLIYLLAFFCFLIFYMLFGFSAAFVLVVIVMKSVAT